MDRIIEVKVNGTYLTCDSQNAGTQGEANITGLRIEFDDGWDGFAKTITWYNAKGENHTSITLTADKLEDITASTRIYLTLIPPEALTVWGKCQFVIDGYINGRRQKSAYGELVVKADPSGVDTTVSDPTPSQAEQLQVQIDTILDDMAAEAIKAVNAKTAAETAQAAAETAKGKAETAQAAAETAQSKAETAQSKAETAQAAAETARACAETAESNAETAQAAAEAAQDAAETAQSAAETAQTAAETAQGAAETAETNARASAASASASESSALSYKSAAEASKTAAAASAGAAATSEANAKASETAAKVSEDNAKASETAAKASETAAKASETAAASSETAAKASETAAKTSETNAKASETAASTSAAQAQANADSMDAEQLNARISAKGDNLEFDEGEGLLYLTSGGERIGDGIKVITSGGGGGGGGEGNNAVLTLTNTTGWIYKSIAYGAACPISVSWSSLEDDLATGSGVLQVIVAGTMKHTAQVEQGEVTIDIGPWLPVGSASVKVKITDVYGNARSLNFNLTTVQLSLESSFDATVAYSGAITYPYTPTGTAAKIVHFKLDGEELDTATVTASGRQQTMTIPAQSHGSHTFEVWFTATVDGETVESNHLYYDLICIEDGNTTPVIATSFRASTAEQYDSIAIPYIVYDPAGLSAGVVLKAGTETVAELTVDRTEQVWTYRADEAGALSLSITCGSAIKLISLTVTESTIDVAAETDSLTLLLSSYGRSNNEADPSVWKSGSVSAALTGFNWTSDGWKADSDGITALRVAGDARVTIPLAIFAQDFRTTGKTIEVEFATRYVLDYDAVVLSCYSGGRGLQITAQKALLQSEQSRIETQYKEDEHVRLAFVVQKRSEYRLLMVYINGILSGAAQYPADDDFSQSAPVGISIGSNSCTTDVYCIRVYDNDLTRHQILDNWIADTQVGLTKKERYDRNKVFDDYGQIVIDQLPTDLPYLILTAAELPQYKGDKKTVSGSYTDPETPGNSFTFTGAQIDVQGTSSQYYARKNYKIKFKDGFTKDGATSPKYQLRSDSVPTDTFTFKADVASSEGANNVELVRLYNEACPYRTPPQEADGTVRQGIDGFPIVVFQDAGDGPKFIGKYNFNNDKGTPEVFGFAAGDESWEILNNTSDRVLWKSDDFAGTDWQNDFEGRYPDGNDDASNLAALATWIKSTDQSAVDTEEEKAARLEKFKAELTDHLELQSTLFYYLFTELFLMVDSRAKNAFPSMLGGDKWCWLPYDMDTAIGTNNEGALVFDYALEDIDQVGTADVFNGQQSVLWVNLRQAYHDELRTMYQTLRSQGKLSYADTESRFEAHQAKWPEAIFNEDSFFKYLDPLFTDGSGAYLGMLQGSKAEQRKWWLYNRFRYMDSKYNAGDSLSDVITVRGYAKANITVTPYADIYATVKYGSYLVQARALRGSSYELVCPLDNVNDTEIYVYSASQIKDVGDLSGLKVGYAEFSMATKLQSLKLGDGADTYENPNLTELYLGNNVLMKTIDVRNCPNLTQAVDLSGCTGLESVYFDGTAVTGVKLPNGGRLKSLHLPATITSLIIRNQPMLTNFSYAGSDDLLNGSTAITTLWLENIPDDQTGSSDKICVLDYLTALSENSRVRLIGFDWTFGDAAVILELCDILDTLRGLDEYGNNVDKAQVSVTVRVENITGAQLAEVNSRYPGIKVVYQHITSNLYFYDETGTTLLYTAAVADGGDGTYGGTTPTKDSTAQFSYTFSGWSLTPGALTADTKALNGVTADRSVYAVFTATVRTYTVYWKNGTTTLETDTNVEYGTTPTYNGSTPVYTGSGEAADYTFNGWTPAVGPITGDTTYTAKFKYNGYVYMQLLERTLTEYTDDTVTSIGEYAFYQCDTLETVSCAAVTSVGDNAFCYCDNLSSVSLPLATELGQNTFRNCTALTSVTFPAVTSLTNGVLQGCSAITMADFTAVTSIGSYVFSGCSALTALILRVDSVCTLQSTSLSNTAIADGTGYIYVPSALVDSYKADDNWSANASQFRAIEDYTDITGGAS